MCMFTQDRTDFLKLCSMPREIGKEKNSPELNVEQGLANRTKIGLSLSKESSMETQSGSSVHIVSVAASVLNCNWILGPELTYSSKLILPL